MKVVPMEILWVVCMHLKPRYRIHISLIMKIFRVAPFLKFFGKSATRIVEKISMCFHEPWGISISIKLEAGLCSRGRKTAMADIRAVLR
jgi:hypothetical protein